MDSLISPPSPLAVRGEIIARLTPTMQDMACPTDPRVCTVWGTFFSATVAQLTEVGFTSTESIAGTSIKELMEKTGLLEEEVGKLLRTAREAIGSGYVTALELLQQRKGAPRLTTGSRNLDRILGGGVETQALTEFIGEWGSGKSQVCMQLCITAQQPPEQGGLGGKVLFIDTEGSFAPHRIYDVARARGLNPEKTLENIVYTRCYSSDHQIRIVNEIANVLEEEKARLVIVDSLISHFRGEFVGREMLVERQQKLNQHVHKLLRLGELYNCAIVVTNQIQSNPQAFFGDLNRPAGGNILAHASTHRLYLRRSKANMRVIRVIDSPYLPEQETCFVITERGVEDAVY